MSQRETYYIDFLTYTFSPGPPLTQARSRHGCTAFKNNGRTIGLVAGGWNPNLDTVEYLDLSQDNPSTWLPGPQIPSKLDDFVLINTNVGVLLLGGYDSTIIDYSHLIQQMVCNTNDIGNCEWQEFGQTLAMKQSSPVVIPIPSSLNLCQHAISTTSQPIEPSTTLAPPGVLATIASLFGENNVSIESVIQEGRGNNAELVLVTHEAAEENLTSSIDSIANLDSVSSVTSTIRVYL